MIKLFSIVRRQGLALPVLTLMVASIICVALVAYRVMAGAQVRHAYLVWNLFLAWLPLLFAVLAAERFSSRTGFQPVPGVESNGRNVKSPGDSDVVLSRQDACPTRILRDRKFLALAAAWLLFFPNAPYIFTDLVHVLHAWWPSFWVQLMLILLCAMTGFLAGFLSLQVMHRLATRLWGRMAGWLFVLLVSGLTGFGVYLGRFVRLNSWDVVADPIGLLYCTRSAVWNVLTQHHDLKFFVLFTLFLVLGYVMLHALASQRHERATLDR